MERFVAARVFSDNMVLQRGKPVRVFGEGCDGALVTAELLGKRAECFVKNGKWLCTLPPMDACDSTELTVRCGEECTTFRNVAIGEVWLAGGQSNMEFELRNCTGGAEALANDKSERVRFYYTQKKTLLDEDFFSGESMMGWTLFDNKESAQYWSAIGYFFAKELSEKLGVTVGIIGCNWGGSSASCWIKREYAIGEAKIYFDEYDEYMSHTTPEQAIQDYRDYQAYHAAWERKSAEYYTTTPNPTWDGCLRYCGENKYPGPPAPVNPMSPGVLHESMIARLCPYTLAGFIFYQGESDDHRPEAYYTLFSQLVRCWRDDWRDDTLPFIFAQLPMHRCEGDEDRKNWCVIREAQAKAYQTIRNTELAVIIDCGEFNEIHPKEKRVAAHRFALRALDAVYGVSEGVSAAPMLKSAIRDGSAARLSFTDSKGGFDIKGAPEGFELCGEDGVYIPATATADGDELLITAPGITHPRGVRYLWTNYAEVHFYAKSGLPLAPFRAEL